MSPPTYLQRVQKVLSDLAKEQQTSISWDNLLAHFVGPLGRDSDMPSPQVRRRIENALRREIFAHRVVKRQDGDDIAISLTDQGVRFYRAWGQVTLFDPEDPRFQRMTIAQVQRQSGVLRNIVHEICDTFFEFKPSMTAREDISQLPTFVSELIESVRYLEQDNIALQLQRNDDEKERRRLQSRFRALQE